jgi:outer membrane protein assembly factor BamB
VTNAGTDQILRRTPNGALSVVAGSGRVGYAGDGGPANRAELNDPGGLAVAADGTIYIADTGNNRIRAISRDGIITTIAGDGRVGSSGVGGAATHADVSGPTAVAIGASGGLYIADQAGIQFVTSRGTLATLVRGGAGAIRTIVAAHTYFLPTALAFDRRGDLFASDESPKLLVEFSPAGRVRKSWNLYVAPGGLSATSSGGVLVADYGFAIDRVVNGQVRTVVRFRLNSLAGLAGAFRPSGVASTTRGTVFASTDGVSGGTDRPALAEITPRGRARLVAP